MTWSTDKSKILASTQFPRIVSFAVVSALLLLLAACQPTPPRPTEPKVEKDDSELFLGKQRDKKSLCSEPYRPNRKRFRSISKRQKNIMRRGYLMEISSKLTGAWHRPAGVPPNAQCQVLIKQRPDGCVSATQFLDCPNTAMRRAVMSTLKSVSPFPEAPHPDVYLDKIRFNFAQ